MQRMKKNWVALTLIGLILIFWVLKTGHVKADDVFSPEVYGGTVQGFIAAVAIVITYQIFMRQRKDMLRDQLYQKRLTLYPAIFEEVREIVALTRAIRFGTDQEEYEKKRQSLLERLQVFDQKMVSEYAIFASKKLQDQLVRLRQIIWQYDQMFEDKYALEYELELMKKKENAHIVSKAQREECIVKWREVKKELDELTKKLKFQPYQILQQIRDDLGVDSLTQEIYQSLNHQYKSAT